MTQQNRVSEPDEHQQENLPADTRKRAYRRPEFQYERVFETTALLCGKKPGSCNPGHGGGHPKS